MTTTQRITRLVELVRTGRKYHPALASRRERAPLTVLFRSVRAIDMDWLVESDGRPMGATR